MRHELPDYICINLLQVHLGKRTSGKIKTDEPSVQAFVQETKAIERARGRGTF